MSQDLQTISINNQGEISVLPSTSGTADNQTINLGEVEGLTPGQFISLINGQEIYLPADSNNITLPTNITTDGTYQGNTQIVSGEEEGQNENQQDLQQIVDQAIQDGSMVQNVIFTVDPESGQTVLQNISGEHFLQGLDASLTSLQIDEHGQIVAVGEDGQTRVVQIEIQQTDQENIPPMSLDELGVSKAVFSMEDLPPPRKPGDPYKCEVCEMEFPKWGALQRHVRLHDEEKPHQCSECSISFNVEANLKLHMATHGLDDPRCPECGTTFSRMASLKSHLRLHEREESIMCQECGDEFPHQRQLDRHMQVHRGELNREQARPIRPTLHRCKQCGLAFPKISELREHTKLHKQVKSAGFRRKQNRNVDRSSFSYPCPQPQCDKMFNKPSLLDRHLRIHTGVRPFKCEHCGKAFNQKGALQVHISAKHGGKKEFTCSVCGQEYAQSGNLRAHIRRCHEPDDPDQPRFICDVCPCSFKKLGSLNAHISKCHSLDKARLIMRADDESEGVENSMREMMDIPNPIYNDASLTETQTPAVHSSDLLQQALNDSGLQRQKDDNTTIDTQQEPIEVEPRNRYSNHYIATMASLNIQDTSLLYRRMIRKANGIRWHQCSFCSKEFKKPSDLIRHIRIHTHEKPYKCTQCFRAFAVKSTLIGHLKTHTGMKDHACSMCDKFFSTSGSLRIHQRLHSGDRPYACDICCKRFRTSGHLRAHVKSHLKGNPLPRRHKRSSEADPERQKQREKELNAIPLQEPILITDTGMIQQPSRAGASSLPVLHPSSDRPYRCSFCSRGFKKSSHLKQHVRSHTGERPFKCGKCLRGFVSSGVLKSHMRTHSGVRLYRCLICDTSFTTNGSLKRHMVVHSEVRPFMCPYCQKTFKTSVNCKKHMKTHRPEIAMQVMDQDQTAGELVDEDDEDADTGDMTGEAHMPVISEQTVEEELVQDMDMINAIQHQNQDSSVRLHYYPVSGTSGGSTVSQVDREITVIPETDMASQTVIQDALDQHELEQTLNQQIFDPQSLGQQYTQVTFSQGQFIMQSPITTGLDNLSSLATSAVELGSAGPQTYNVESSEQLEESLEEQNEVEADDGDCDYEPNDPSRQFRCKTCSKAFKKSSHLKQHERNHTGERPYQCDICDKMFVSAGVLKQHQKTHSGLKTFRCETCDAMFTTKGSLHRHARVHLTKFHKCHLCSDIYDTFYGLKCHLRDVHDLVVASSNVLHKSQGRSVNYNNEEEESAPDHQSQTGHVTLDQQAFTNLQAEQEEAEGAQEPQEDLVLDASQKDGDSSQFDLTLSEKLLLQSAAEKNRISLAKSDPEYSAIQQCMPKLLNQCSQCPKSFKKPSDLIRHTRTHTGERPFQCHLCAKTFTVKSTLDCHLKTHNQMEKTLRCHICSTLFATKGSLKVHMRLHTGAKPFRCPHCPMKFRTSGHRKSHVFQHFKPVGANFRSKVDKLVQQDSDSELGDQVTAHGNTQIVPLTLNLDSITDPNLASQIMSSLEGIQLQIPADGLGNIHLTTVDPNSLTQTVQIDGMLLEQLQQPGINLQFNSIVNEGAESVNQSTNQGTVSISRNQSGEYVTLQSGVATNQDAEISVLSANQRSVLDALTEQSVDESASSYQNAEFQAANQSSLSNAVRSIDVSALSSLVENNDVIMASANQMMNRPDAEATGENNIIDWHCDRCDGVFTDADSYRDHVTCAHPAKSMRKSASKHPCPLCDKVFDKPSQLVRHERIHTGERPFKCDLCTRAFNQKNALHMHLRKHAEDRAFKCAYCTMAFVQKGNLKTHIRRAHQDEVIRASVAMRSARSLDAEVEAVQPVLNMEEHDVGEHEQEMPLVDISSGIFYHS